MQTNYYPAHKVSRGRGAQRGQTIVVALLVLLLIGFIGGVFVAIVTRTLQAVNRTNRVQSADFYAEAGVRFADQQLTTSLDGADWRPPLQYALLNPPTGALENARYVSVGLGAVPANDPDRAYLEQGFTRYNIGGGRYLLRVTYDPLGFANQNNKAQGSAYSDPLTRYIKIESVGREGTVDSLDPTTYRNVPATRLNATLVQYKAIGITDYTRFETNPDNRSDIMGLGVAGTFDASGNIVTPGTFDFASGNALTLTQYPVVTTYGASDAYINTGGFLSPNPNAAAGGAPVSGAVPGGGGIRANGSVRLFGANQAYLSTTGTAFSGFDEGWQIAGNFLLDDYDPSQLLNTKQKAALVLYSLDSVGAPVQNYATPTNDPNGYKSFNGQVRDGSTGTDINGQPRNVNRLEPPTLDALNPVTSLPRYRDIAKNAPERLDEASVAGGSPMPYLSGAAKYGYGQSVYVDNTGDVQRESSRLVGGYTLVDEWLHRTNAAAPSGAKSGWTASFYRPPGVDLIFGRQRVLLNSSTSTPTRQSFYGFRAIRSDLDGAGNLIGWKNPDGTPIADVNADGTSQSTMTVSYKSLNASNPLDPTGLTGAQQTAYQANPNNDVTIYLEGNVRLHGVVSADPLDLNAPTTLAGGTGTTTDDDHLPRHVTIVTNGTAYIEGSLLRGNPESTITVMAHDYVCVNTTQFLAGTIADQNPLGTTAPGAFVGDPSLQALDFSASDEVLLQEFTLAGAPRISNNPLRLYISGGAGSSGGGTSADYDIIDARSGLNFYGQSLFTSNVAAFGNGPTPYNAATPTTPFSVAYNLSGAGQTELFRGTFELPNLQNPSLSSQSFQLGVRRSQGTDTSGNPTGINSEDYLQERAALLPMDVRIEAVLFAQTKSFFVIPGDWFNTSSTDNLSAFVNPATTLTANQRRTRPDVNNDDDSQGRFPFYGQPIDMKIIISGAVSEARPADITAQSAWMGKWGWIPQFHGSLTGSGPLTGPAEPAGHVAYKADGTTPANTPATGLSIIYNPLAGYPYYGGHYMRSDIYGRALPFSPKLPVCTGLLYAGQNTSDQSVLQ